MSAIPARHKILVGRAELSAAAEIFLGLEILVSRTGAGPQFAITMVTSDAEDHQRHHLDLYVDDAGVEIDRLIDLGAQRVKWRYPPGADYVVLADPDGNRFCVVEKP